MTLKYYLIIVFVFCITKSFSQHYNENVDNSDTKNSNVLEILDLDSLLKGSKLGTVIPPLAIPAKTKKRVSPLPQLKNVKISEAIGKQAFDSLLIVQESIEDTTKKEFTFSKNCPLVPIDSLVLKANPFFIEMVYWGLPYQFKFNTEPDFQTLYYGNKATSLKNEFIAVPKAPAPELYVTDLRRHCRDEITRNAAHLYVFMFDELPDPNGVRSELIAQHRMDKVKFVDENESSSTNKKLTLKKIIASPWTKKANSLVQFSQNSVSSNWYQGGTSNLAILGILSGKLNYDNKKNIQWDNSAEWRLGFNTVSGDTLRSLSTNDDVLKINSKLGIKASGNWFYSGSVDFSTQFFDSYKGINSTVKKAAFLTPVRLNVGIGLDYKYKKTFSLMISPVAYKYIYINKAMNVNPNLFGIKKDENVLSEIGSSFKALLSLPVTREIQLDSKLSFYTNYKKVEVDMEVVCNMTINRFMSTRISLNPRYDNTIIEKNGDKAGIQYKQLLSVGFSHRFR